MVCYEIHDIMYYFQNTEAIVITVSDVTTESWQTDAYYHARVNFIQFSDIKEHWTKKMKRVSV